jgi:nondiscriminating aspartyl-tRNA synthetase
MKRTLISETPRMVGEKVRLSGWVKNRRDHGKLVFVDLRDRSGVLQMVVIPDKSEVYQKAKEIRNEFVISVEGLIKERPGGQAREGNEADRVEMEVSFLEIISPVKEELPFDVSGPELDINISTLLDNRNLALRNEKVNNIFKVYSQIIKSYAETMRGRGFLEIKTPKIVSSATEGGANFFKVKYFKKEAFLAQSPQFYKQAGVSAFERVFEIGPVFRAEPHYTTRHVNEYVSLDAEMGFIENFSELMDELTVVMKKIVADVQKNCAGVIEKYGSEIFVPEFFPRIKLADAVEILEKEYGKKTEGLDIDPEGERMIAEWVRKNHNSDFVFLTHYPVSVRPFYAMPSKENPTETESFDLIFKGVEIATGGQRIHSFDQLEQSIKKHRLQTADFADYLEIFKIGMPPHGGWGLGSERIVQKILGLKNIKEAILFPRDVRRLTP